MRDQCSNSLRSFLNYTQQFMLIRIGAMGWIFDLNSSRISNVLRWIRQMMCSKLCALCHHHHRRSLIISSSFVLSISVAVCMSYEAVPFAPNRMVKIDDGGEKIASYQAVLLNTSIYFFLPDQMSFGQCVFIPFYSLTLASHRFVVYAARQLFYFLFVCEWVSECACVFIFNTMQPPYIRINVWLCPRRCSFKSIYQWKDMLLPIVAWWSFAAACLIFFRVFVCVWSNQRPTDRERVSCFIRAHLAPFMHPKNAFVRRQKKMLKITME